MRPVIALLTDFGAADHYSGAMKGVILGICPDVTLVDITHDIPPHDVTAGALELAAAYKYFPAGTIFVAVVDPETLRVQVRQGAGPWRHADYLSEGTKEQIFLLLRVALAEHLTRPGEKAPLILDEITAQCDAARRAALLDLLHELSCDRQIILFTHDEGALEWAEANLDLGGADAVVRREVLEAVTA